MSAFRFHLGRVLRVRRATEEIQRVRLAEAEGDARVREDEAASRAQSVRDAEESLRADQSAGELDAARILVAIDASARLAAIERGARLRATTARTNAESERATWRDARAGVLGLERLEDRERGRFRTERDAREERAIEEVAARRAEEQRRHQARTRNPS
jgi:flagellar export protein FliJ